MTRDVIAPGPASGADVMANLNGHIARFWDASVLPLDAVGGTGDAATATLDPPLLAGLVAGMKVTLTWDATNTGGVTLAINGGTAQPVLDAAGDALVVGALASGLRSILEWDGAAWRALSPLLAGGGAGVAAQR